MRLTEKEIVKRLWESAEQYKPLFFMGFEEEFLLAKRVRADAIVEISMENGPSFKAIVEIAAVANPKTVLQKCRLLRDEINKINEPDLVPVIVAPYIGRRQTKILADEGVSWIDLSGNMVVQVPNQLYVERTGKPNKFIDTAPIKKIFQGTSSLVSRALLLKPEGFSCLYEVADFINNRNASITVSTVSKVLKSLEQELLVEKNKSLISVIYPEKLLGRLTEDYISSTKRKERKTYKFATDSTTLLFLSLYQSTVEYAACGFYAAKLKGLATTDQVSIFVNDMEQVRRAIKNNQIALIPDAEFGNINITETNDPGVWFNTTLISNDWVVDDIELYLEMMADTPRGPKIAEILKRRILKGEPL